MNRAIAHWGRKENIDIGLHKFEEMIYGHFLKTLGCSYPPIMGPVIPESYLDDSELGEMCAWIRMIL